MARDWRRTGRAVLKGLNVLLYFFVLYLLILGLGRFKELHPWISNALGWLFAVLLPLALLALLVYWIPRCVKAFREGAHGTPRDRGRP